MERNGSQARGIDGGRYAAQSAYRIPRNTTKPFRRQFSTYSIFKTEQATNDDRPRTSNVSNVELQAAKESPATLRRARPRR